MKALVAGQPARPTRLVRHLRAELQFIRGERAEIRAIHRRLRLGTRSQDRSEARNEQYCTWGKAEHTPAQNIDGGSRHSWLRPLGITASTSAAC